MPSESKKTVPTNTEAAPENSALVGLRESEAAMVEKQKRLNAMDANEQLRGGIDINAVKRNNDQALANVRKEIAKLSK